MKSEIEKDRRNGNGSSESIGRGVVGLDPHTPVIPVSMIGSQFMQLVVEFPGSLISGPESWGFFSRTQSQGGLTERGSELVQLLRAVDGVGSLWICQRPFKGDQEQPVIMTRCVIVTRLSKKYRRDNPGINMVAHNIVIAITRSFFGVEGLPQWIDEPLADCFTCNLCGVYVNIR